MERYCGFIQPAFKSRRYPYASVNRYVLDHARLSHIRVLYDASDVLRLRAVDLDGYHGAVCLKGCKFKFLCHAVGTALTVLYTR